MLKKDRCGSLDKFILLFVLVLEKVEKPIRSTSTVLPLSGTELSTSTVIIYNGWQMSVGAIEKYPERS
jgi:hypothetical protein